MRAIAANALAAKAAAPKRVAAKKTAATKAASRKAATKRAARGRKTAIHIRRKATASEIRAALGITESARRIAAAAVDEAGIE